MSEWKLAEATNSEQVASEWKAKLNKYWKSLKYSLYVITHPFDGFWDLTHEHKGSLPAAHTILILFLITRVLKLLLTSFQFLSVNVQYISVPEEVGSLLLPFLILCIANWAMTTLFDGKGRFKDIYIGLCYALVPYVLIQLPMIWISNMLTFEEASIYSVLTVVSVIWCVFLAYVALMQIHDYSPGKTLFFVFVTILGACVIIFLLLVFFSLLSDAFGFFVSFYREASYRLN